MLDYDSVFSILIEEALIWNHVCAFSDFDVAKPILHLLFNTHKTIFNQLGKHQTFNLMVTTLKDFRKFAKHVQVSACKYFSIFDNFVAFSNDNAKYYVSQLLHKTVLHIFAGGRFDTYRRVKNANKMSKITT